MNLRLIGKFPNETSLLVKINREEYYLTESQRTVNIQLEKNTTYIISVETPSTKPLTGKSIAIFVLTCAIQGLFNVLLQNTDRDWYDGIIAYGFKSEFPFEANEDCEICLIFENAVFNENLKTWSAPLLSTQPDMNLSVSYFLNHHEFRNRWFRCVKRIVSVVAVIQVLLVTLFYFAIKNGNPVSWLLLVLMITALAVASYVIYKEYKIMRDMTGGLIRKDDQS